jgi:glutamate-1-semialdehyde aminotransferase
MTTRVALMGTYPGNRVSCAAGLAQLKYIAAHKDEVYPYIVEHAAWLQAQVNAHAVTHQVPIEASTSDGGLVLVHRRTTAPTTPVTGTPMDPVVLLQTYLRDHGVYFNGAPIQMSLAHRSADLERVSAAFSAAMRDLVVDGCGQA